MKHRAKLLQFALTIRASYWFIPAVMVLAATILAYAAYWIDRHPEILPYQLPDGFLNTQVDGARSTLSTIGTSIIGVTGVMFSMTLVAVSFAAGNYGPRLISNFMRDHGNQVSFGILISTFVYALLILRMVQDPSEGTEISAFVPQYSILIAIAGCFLSVFTMIYFVHHVPETINVANISANLGQTLELAVKKIIDAQEARGAHSAPAVPDTAPDCNIYINKTGYIQVLRFHRILELCSENSWTIDVCEQPGDFITKFTPVLRVWSSNALSKDDISELQECFAVGTSRTESQDLFFVVDELVEMLARALSPGINDPFTAINCLNWMHNALKTAKYYKNGLGEAGSSSFELSPNLTFDALFDRSFGAAKPYCEPDKLVFTQYTLLAQDLKEDR